MPIFELDVIQTTALTSAVVRLSPDTLALIGAALDLMTSRYNWFDSSDDTTWDEIEAVVGQAYNEVWKNMLVGSVVWIAGDAPDGTLYCDGTSYERSLYPALYAALDAAYILDADNFRVPDLRGVFLRGSSSSLSIGDVGGEAEHTLTEAEMPTHSHTYVPPTINVDIEAPGVPDPVAAGLGLPTQTGNAGGGIAHNNLPPFEVLRPCIIAV